MDRQNDPIHLPPMGFVELRLATQKPPLFKRAESRPNGSIRKLRLCCNGFLGGPTDPVLVRVIG